MATDEFYNPYQFLPLDEETYGLGEGLPGKAAFETGGGKGTRASHAAYSAGTLHGRIICRLTLKDPLFIGAGRKRRNKDDGDYMVVEPYRIGGEPAIPASSLRGLISSLAEAASGSALRVLDDTPPKKPKRGARAQTHSMWDFFPDELRPYNPARTTISPAEWMFGFVSAGKVKDGARGAYAGRVRFSAARLAEPVPAGERDDLFLQGDMAPGHGDPPGPKYVRLKILAQPKPPCPAMYFRPDESNRPIAKHKLDVHGEPNGRKVYLHYQGNKKANPWQTKHEEENKNQKNAIRPLDPKACNKRGGGFWFHVDFDNLSQGELDLLCFALSPSPEFHHKLGMGKPIGLGGVHIEPVALMLIDRSARYGRGVDLFAAPRHHAVWTDPAASLPRRWYAREAQAAGSSKAAAVDDCRMRADRHRKKLNGPLRRAILLTGNPDELKPGVPMHYPLRSDQGDDEHETFKWFVANAKRGVQPKPQALPRIGETNPPLAPLKKNRVPDNRRR